MTTTISSGFANALRATATATATLAAWLIVLALSAASLVAADSKRPNFVVILADDLGFADVGFNGGKEIRTPHLDALAASGSRLLQFYVQPVCSPTRAAFLTGRYPMRQGLQTGVIRPWATYGLPLEERTLAQALKELNYTTSLVGKWHLGAHAPEFLPTRRGFDHHYGHYLGAIDYFTHERDGGFDWHRDGAVNRDEGYSTHLLAREAARVIRDQPAGKPLFLYVAFNAVHTPMQVPDSYKEPYAGLRPQRRTYAGMLAAMDEGIGEILAALDATGLRTNTLVFFCSDNGGPAPGRITDNSPLRAGKGTLYEGGVRVVACVSWPGRIKAGGINDEPMHIADLYPTLLKLAGGSLKKEPRLDGLDVWPVLSRGRRSPHDEILLNTEPNRGAILKGDWKLVLMGLPNTNTVEGAEVDPAPRPRQRAHGAKMAVELYNLARDIGETTNVAEQNRGKVRELRRAYDRLAAEAAAPRAAPAAPGFKAPAIWGEFP